MLNQGVTNKADILSLLSGEGKKVGKGQVLDPKAALGEKNAFLTALNAEVAETQAALNNGLKEKLGDAETVIQNSEKLDLSKGTISSKLNPNSKTSFNSQTGIDGAKNNKGLNLLQDVDSELQKLQTEGKTVVKVGGRNAELNPEFALTDTNKKQASTARSGKFDPLKVLENRKSIFDVQKKVGVQPRVQVGAEVQKPVNFVDLKNIVNQNPQLSGHNIGNFQSMNPNDQIFKNANMSEGLNIGVSKDAKGKVAKSLDFKSIKNNKGINKNALNMFKENQKPTESNLIKLSKENSSNEVQSSEDLMKKVLELNSEVEGQTLSKEGQNTQQFNQLIKNQKPLGMNLSTNATFQLDEASFQGMDNAQVVEKVSDYIAQKSLGNQKEIELNVQHKDLGEFLIRVTREEGAKAQSAVNIQIKTVTTEGKDFFTSNQGKLLTSLSASGVNVNDLKLDSSSNSSMNFSQNGSSSGEQGGSQNSQSRQDSERRRELWNQYKERAA